VSKVNELRRKASDAVRGREYDRAIELYKRICKLEPSNGTPCNELGDLYLKTGNTPDAIESFSLSARLYSDFGLTNNAVAVYKKILRHDPNHLDSLWGLAEIRREQGMEAEASTGFLDFLARVEQVPEAGREVFFRQCTELMEKMSDDLEILSRLEEIYRTQGRGDDVARVLIAKAMQAHIEGEHEVRDRYVEHAREASDYLDSLPAYQEYLDVVDPVDYCDPGDAGAPQAITTESGVIELDDDEPGPLPDLTIPDDGINLDDSAPRTVAINTDALDLGFDFQPEELDHAVSRSTHNVADDDVEPGHYADAPTPGPEHPEAADSMNLLDEILADGSFDVQEDQRRQVETIASEMQGQIAGDVDADDHGGQYELGVVYMDMGLFEQAITAFDAAALGEDYRLGALEMRGTCLLRLGRDIEAMDSFRAGLAIEGAPERAYLGLLYGIGCCLELRGDMEQAQENFQRVADVDAKFLDVSRKLEQMQEPR
jgi:tetratricopeptide (TPR) repeat protein